MASVSVDQVGVGRFKVRWREWVEDGGERRQAARSQVVSSREAAIELQAKVLRAVETSGCYEPEGRQIAEVANIETAAADWLKHKAARGASSGTIRKYAWHMQLFFKGVRVIKKIGEKEPVPATALSRTLFSDVILAWRARGLGEGTVYSTSALALDMWKWVSDDPDIYPSVPLPPRDPTTVIPLPPVYSAPSPPTLAEADACLRQINRVTYVSRSAAILMRFTGLRVSQVLGMKWGDVDLVNATLRVRVGKTRREKAESRTVPVSAHLVAEMVRWREGRGAEDFIVHRRKDQRADESKSHLPSAILSDAWEAATEAGEARREAWAPATRKLARPDHAFRAAFMAFLEAEGVRDSVIDFLVGHAPSSTRRRHYAPPGMEQLREAIGRLPEIEWRDVVDGVKVVRMRRG